jgi:sulfoxide reductase heme-binding subunit YedZ
VAAAVAALAVILAIWIVRVGVHVAGGNAGSSANAFADSSRALGIAALVLAAAALPVGLLVGRRLVRGARARWLRAFHRSLALWCLTAIALHVLTLAGATTLGPSVVRLLVPFVWPYRTLATGLGVLAAWATAALGMSYYLRRVIGPRRWRIAHRFIVLGLLLGVLHTIGGG